MFDCTKEMIITGTDTDVGKTLLSVYCLNRSKGTYWKPIQSGSPSDRQRVQAATGLGDSHFLKEIYHLSRPLSPHEAAIYDQQEISFDRIKLPADVQHRPLIIEGAGGVLVPLNRHQLMVDLFCHLALPVVVVARSSLGTINHTLMTLECLRSRGMAILGVVMIGPSFPENEKAVSYYGKVNVSHLASLY